MGLNPSKVEMTYEMHMKTRKSLITKWLYERHFVYQFSCSPNA